MISDTQMRYGSRDSRQGSLRWCFRYHASSARRSPGASRTSSFVPSTDDRAMTDPASIRQRFQEMIQRPEVDIDLARSALLVAAENDPGLDVEAEMARLDSWAGELSRRLDPSWNNLQRLARLRTFMYEDLG